MKRAIIAGKHYSGGLRLKTFLIRLFFLSFFISPSFIFSQSVQDSIASDSIDKAFRQQVISNQAAIGADTTVFVVEEPDTLSPVKSSNDSLNVPAFKDSKVNTRIRKFYWNDRRANADSLGVGKVYRHSPLYASLFSMALPGLGQAYNRRYWKIPIVYAGFAGLGYAIYHTGSNFIGYRNAYRLQVDGDNTTYGSYKGVDGSSTLKEYRDYYKKNLDISVICTAVWYILNIVDAAVDAHLFEWNMKDDIHLSWRPTVITGQPDYPQATAGIRLALNF